MTPNPFSNMKDHRRDADDLIEDLSQEYKTLYEQWLRNREFYENNRSAFMREYPGRCVAVHDEKIIATGSSVSELAGDLYRKLGNIPFYVDFPDEQEPVELNFPLTVD
ncbi:MAG: hypothetical protein GC154_10675 [bacterium]|nr:hypothetical protein [bacterium]